jgi:hypothetical protein|nr:MAG TPA: sigma factor [Caudoviricetes sp.]
MNNQRTITEEQFMAHCDESLRQLAREVRGCGMSVYQIAKQSGLTWRTVKKVTDGIPVRFDTAERIRFVMQQNASTAIGN